MELWKEKEEENRYLWNFFVLGPTVVSGFDPDSLEIIRSKAVLLVEPELMCSAGLMTENCFPVQRCSVRLDRDVDDWDVNSLNEGNESHIHF